MLYLTYRNLKQLTRGRKPVPEVLSVPRLHLRTYVMLHKFLNPLNWLLHTIEIIILSHNYLIKNVDDFKSSSTLALWSYCTNVCSTALTHRTLRPWHIRSSAKCKLYPTVYIISLKSRSRVSAKRTLRLEQTRFLSILNDSYVRYKELKVHFNF